MNKLISDLANAAERALQWVDAGRSDNPSQARYDIKMLRQLITEARKKQHKHPETLLHWNGKDTIVTDKAVYQTQNTLVEAVNRDIEKVTKIKDVPFGPQNSLPDGVIASDATNKWFLPNQKQGAMGSIDKNGNLKPSKNTEEK